MRSLDSAIRTQANFDLCQKLNNFLSNAKLEPMTSTCLFLASSITLESRIEPENPRFLVFWNNGNSHHSPNV